MALTKNQQILRYVIYPVLALGVLGVLTYVLVARPLQIRNQKLQFEKAEASLDTLAAQIEQNIGKPDEVKKEKSCGYASRVYAKGPRGCSIQYVFAYGVSDSNQANLIRDNLSRIIKASTSPLTISYSSDSAFTSIQNNKVQRNDFDLNFQDSELSCSSNLVYAKSDNSSLLLHSASKEQSVSVELSCGGSAMSEFFPASN